MNFFRNAKGMKWTDVLISSDHGAQNNDVPDHATSLQLGNVNVVKEAAKSGTGEQSPSSRDICSTDGHTGPLPGSPSFDIGIDKIFDMPNSTENTMSTPQKQVRTCIK